MLVIYCTWLFFYIYTYLQIHTNLYFIHLLYIYIYIYTYVNIFMYGSGHIPHDVFYIFVCIYNILKFMWSLLSVVKVYPYNVLI